MSRMVARSAFVLVVALAISAFFVRRAPRSLAALPDADVASSTIASGARETAVLAGGCFWGMEGVFEHVKGVLDVVSGYAGGTRETADYETVSSGSTHHAESVRITFDPSKVSYATLLKVFFSVAHDPTELNRQGPDEGTQYRSAIFFANEEQAREARAYIAQLDSAHVFPAPIVTEVTPLAAFYPAEAYHQDFMRHNPDYPYIVYNDLPKLEHLRTQFPQLYREDWATR